MRLQEEIVRSGIFWLPAMPNHRLFGRLTISDGGGVELEVVGNFDVEVKLFDDTQPIARIVGEIEREGFVTLEGCQYRTKAFPLGPMARSTLVVDFAIFGVKYDEEEELEFNTFQFGLESLEQWIGISGVQVAIAHQQGTTDISYAPPEDIRIRLTDGVTLTVKFEASLHSASDEQGASINERNYLRLESSEALPLNAYLGLASKLTNFLCFAVDATVCMKEVVVSNREITREFSDDEKQAVPIPVYYSSRPHSALPSRIKKNFCLFLFSDVAEDFEGCVSGWLTAYEEIKPSLNLYFSTKYGGHRYLEPKFLALAQAVETLHRRTELGTLMPKDEFASLVQMILEHCPSERQGWLRGRLSHGNELSLRQRLNSVAKPFTDLLGGKRAVREFVRKTVDTRNYLTHYDERLSSTAAEGADLITLVMKLEALLELHLLQRVGFSPERIATIAERSGRLPQKLRFGSIGGR